MILQRVVGLILPFKKKNDGVKVSLRTKFTLAFLVTILLPLFILGIELYRESTKIIEKNVYKYTLEAMRQVSKSIDYYLGEMERITQLPTTNEDLLGYLEDYNFMSLISKVHTADKINKILSNYAGLRSDLSGVYLFDSYNNFFYIKGKSPRYGYDWKSEKWYKDTLFKSGNVEIIGTHLQYHVENRPEYVISVSREIRSFATKKTLGVIFVDFNYNILGNIIDNETSDTFLYNNLYILDEQGTIIFNNNCELLEKNFNYSFSEKIFSSKYGTFTENIDNQKVLIVFYTSPYSSWKFINIIPLNIVLKDIILIRNLAIIIMFVCLLIVFILSIEISYKLIKPIKLLADAMLKVRNGDFSANIEVKSNDETKLLAESFNSMAKNIKNLIEKVYYAQLNQKEAELKALQSQINPHFLYNTLDSIRGVAIYEGVNSISIMVEALSNLFKYNICKGKEIVNIKEEIEHTKNYITIQNFRYEDKFEIIYKVDESLSSYKILKLLLQPLVENAIYHGLETKIGRGTIIISCERIGELIKLSVSDNGSGISKSKLVKLTECLEKNAPYIDDTYMFTPKSSKGIAVTNVNARIKLYFGSQYGLLYKSEEGMGTTAEIYIPAMKE